MKTLNLPFAKISPREHCAPPANSSSDPPDWIHVIMGPSSAGKSTFARWLAGLSPSNESFLRADTQILCNEQIRLSPQLRRIGFMAQGDLLFPHLSVERNVGYGLRKWSSHKRQDRVQQIVKLTGLEGLEKRRPAALSGGEKRRVALAQVLAIDPQLLILDEPFSGLDLPAKQILWSALKAWIETFQLPTILITHDLREAEAMSAKIHQFARFIAKNSEPVRNSATPSPNQ